MKFLTIPAMAVALSLSAGTALADHHKSGGKDRMGHYFTKMDSNKDGVITRAEFTAKSNKMFDKLDMNNDGKVTREEAKQAKKKWSKGKKKWDKHKKHDGKKGHKYHGDKRQHDRTDYMRRDSAAANTVVRGENAPRSSRVLQR